jgi:hypothetical protein
MWKIIVERGRPHMTIWRMRIAYWTPKAGGTLSARHVSSRDVRIVCPRLKVTNTHSEYVILIAFPLLQWLHERASLLRRTDIACLVRDISGANGDVYGVFYNATPFVGVKVRRYVLFNDAVNFLTCIALAVGET